MKRSPIKSIDILNEMQPNKWFAGGPLNITPTNLRIRMLTIDPGVQNKKFDGVWKYKLTGTRINQLKKELLQNINHRRFSVVLTSPEGVDVEVNNLSAFASEHGLSQSRLSLLVNGRCEQALGWTCKNPREQKEVDESWFKEDSEPEICVKKMLGFI